MVTNNGYSQNFQVAPIEGNFKFQLKIWIIGSVFLIILLSMLSLVLIFTETRTTNFFIKGIFTLFLIIIVSFGGMWAMIGLIHLFYSPRLYTVGAKGIIVKRLIGNVCIHYSEIQRTAIIDSMPIWWVLGATLLFEIGTGPVSTFVTRSEKLLLIETSKRKYYLSPLKPDEMLDTILRYLKENKKSNVKEV
ncbi:hypothetical protein G7K71_15190 [Desulfofundulus sp. TPOSR]|uniref:PH domain-containing protein n=1 Tax=Desulfofundulus sp. TPOSR TaxID=2714340 RepID=UPI001409A23B|nr:PH domain-containing protein [Desulfofundulus sp. TPOSR]NHM28294.1 hypothetical protein [Desulfofundulus sp. TPOSR]